MDLLKNRIQYLFLFAYYAYLIVPYFFGGLVVCLCLSGMTDKVNRLYFVNLAGSGAGCLLFLPVLKWAGGAGSIFVVVALALLGAFFFALKSRSKGRAVAAVLLCAAAFGCLPFSETLLDIQPAPSKLMSYHLNEQEDAGEVIATRWDPLCRVDVVRSPGSGINSIYQDGDAPTIMMEWEDNVHPPMDHYALGYIIKKNPKVLIIGVGGGQDIRVAMARNASSIIGAEINPTIADLMRDEFGDFTGHVYDRDPAKVHVAEGRSFLRRSDETYDVIQMTGTDTYSALSSGSYILSESYLYTVDAFEDYLDHLSDDGVVAILRFRFYPPRECMRLVAIGAEAMKRKGIEDPSKHILVVSYKRPPIEVKGQMITMAYAVMLFKKTPFTEQEIRKYEQFSRLKKGDGGYALSYASGREGEADFMNLMAAVRAGGEKEFFAESRYEITPVGDDKPFFFRYHRWSQLFQRITAPNYQGVIGEDPVGLFILLSVFLEATVLVILLVVLPLLLFRRKGLKTSGSGSILVYFFALGLAYMFVEIGAMQKFVLFLGHPTYSLSIVLFSFLLFSGVGSLFGGRFAERPGRGIALAVTGVALLIVLYLILLEPVFAWGLAFATPVRMALSVALLAPLAFFMGMPFPLGLRVVDRKAKDLIPWAFGVNGGASVLSSVLSILIAMETGFTVVFVLAGLLYVVGWLLFRRLAVSPA